jgi:NADH-quinone oxidoreductase subunit L
VSLSPEHLLWLVLLTPLGAAVASALFFRRSRGGAPVLSCAAAGVSAGAAGALLVSVPSVASVPLRFSYPWLALGAFKVDMGFLIDANAAAMLFVVSFVAFWIHVFSVGYMSDDGARGRFFAGLSVFMFSILGIVVADNLYMIFVFWELVGFSSYMLIAHYFDKGFAVAASKKAFITNRVGDLGFLAGIVLCHAAYGTVGLPELAAAAGSGAVEKSTLIGFLLMCGFLGKSAQFPLHVWLADAMAGPTPVSALIHAATMVAAGVYLMVRVFFLLTAPVLDVLLWSCAAMAALGAACALGQVDIKKSLAYSTLSHLGFMGAALGLGLPEIALLHLTMHAFFKATLFLCAGSVIHACHHEQDMTRMGGLWRRMPVTAGAFLCAGASLCALPFFAGYYSKDMILSGALLGHNYGAFALLLVAALGSAFYIGRMAQLVFLGEANSTDAGHARESGAWMAVPLVVLGLCSVGAGWGLGGGRLFFQRLIPDAALAAFAGKYHALYTQLEAAHLGAWMLALSVVVGAGGLGAAVWFYRKRRGADALRETAPMLYRVLEYRWADTLYDAWIARVQQPLANAVGFLDTLLINGLGVRAIGAGLPALLGLLSRRYLHTGNLHHYVYWFVLGALFYGAVILLG